MAQCSGQLRGVVAIDGKALRRSLDRASGKSALRTVSAWGAEQRLKLAQIATGAESNSPTRSRPRRNRDSRRHVFVAGVAPAQDAGPRRRDYDRRRAQLPSAPSPRKSSNRRATTRWR